MDDPRAYSLLARKAYVLEGGFMRLVRHCTVHNNPRTVQKAREYAIAEREEKARKHPKRETRDMVDEVCNGRT